MAAGLSLPLDAVTSTFAVIGIRGSGKTVALAVLCEEMLKNGVPVAIVDPTGAHWGLRSSASGMTPGFPVVIFGGRHADVPLEPGSGRMIAELLVAERIPVILDVSQLRKSQRHVWAADFFEALYELNSLALHVVVDEAHQFAPQRMFPGSERMVGAIEDVVLLGRIRGLGVSLATQRPALLNKNVLTQVETLIMLRTTGRPDIAALDDWIANHADPVRGREVKADLASLETGHGWVWSPHFLGVLQKVTIRRRETFDSSATPKVGQTQVTPERWANIDVASLGERVRTAIDTAKAADPKALHARIAQLERQLATAATAPHARGADDRAEVATLRAAVAQREEHITELTQRLDTAADAAAAVLTTVSAALDQQRRDLDSLVDSLRAQVAQTSAATPPTSTPAPVKRERRAPTPAAVRPLASPASAPPAVTGSSSSIELRSGARRMVETLGRMSPRRLTKSQWGTVAHLKTTGGTWSTYLSDIRRAGLLDETPAGYTLTDAGFDFLGGRPAPMTAAELQQHYRQTLRSGAAKMLDALIAAHPNGLTKDELGAAADIVTTGGTFSTYLSDLVRNGLAARNGTTITATSILMTGTQA